MKNKIKESSCMKNEIKKTKCILKNIDLKVRAFLADEKWRKTTYCVLYCLLIVATTITVISINIELLSKCLLMIIAIIDYFIRK